MSRYWPVAKRLTYVSAFVNKGGPAISGRDRETRRRGRIDRQHRRRL